jgi:hypothetical protein
MLGWKVVLRKEPRGTRVALGVHVRPEMQCFTIGRDEAHLGLTPHLLHEDTDVFSPIMQYSRVLDKDEVNRELLAAEEEPEFEDIHGADNDGAEGKDKDLYN